MNRGREKKQENGRSSIPSRDGGCHNASMQQSLATNALQTLPPGIRVALVKSSYYPELLSSMEEAAMTTLQEGGVSAENVEIIRVPGSFEIPLICKELAEKGGVDGVLALGVIVQGETHHASEIARATTDGLMQVQLLTGMPIGHGVLYVDTLHQAKDRCLGRGNKGGEVARSLLSMMSLLGKKKSTTSQ